MLGRFTRTFLVVLLAAVMAGAAVAFAMGVQFAPRASCPNPGYGSNCPGKKHFHLKKISVHLAVHNGQLNFSFTNHTGTTVKIKLVVLLRSHTGQIIRIVKSVKLKPGETFTFKLSRHKVHTVIHLNVPAKFKSVCAGRVSLSVSDAAGDHASVSRQVGNFRACHAPKKAHHPHPHHRTAPTNGLG
jgi:hypothetical protein